MSNFILQKLNIIYTRLYKEYGNWKSIEKFMMEAFGQERQSFYDRKRAKTIPYDELKKAFPDINTEWLYSNDLNELQSMPVRNIGTNSDRHEENFLHIKSQIDEEGMPYNAQDLLLEALEDEARRIQSDLTRLTNQIHKIRLLKKSSDNPDNGDDQS